MYISSPYLFKLNGRIRTKYVQNEDIKLLFRRFFGIPPVVKWREVKAFFKFIVVFF